MIKSIGFKIDLVNTTISLGQFFWVNSYKGYILSLPAYKGLGARWIGCGELK